MNGQLTALFINQNCLSSSLVTNIGYIYIYRWTW